MRAAYRRPVGLLLAAALVGTAGATAACRRTPQPRAAARTTACSVLRATEVTAALGAPLAPPSATTDAGADALAGRSGCAWATTDETKAVLVELVRTRDMSASVRRTGFSASARFAAARSRHPTGRSVPEVSDQAIWVDETATLHVLQDASYLTFEVAMPVPADARGVAVTLAGIAVKRLSQPVDQAN